MRVRSAATLFALLLSASCFAQTFSNHYYSGAGNGSGAIVSADFDKNGWPDVAVHYNDSSAGGGVSVRLGTGSGNLGARRDYAIPSGGVMEAADLDADGWTDLALSGDGFSVVLLINNHDGTFHIGPSFAVGGTPQEIQFGDFNRDGKIDMAVVVAPEEANSDWQLEVLVNQGGGNFTTSQVIGPFGGLEVGDYNRDGRLDLVNARGNSFTVWRGTGTGTFVSTTPVVVNDSFTLSSTATADFNNDGSLDLAMMFAHACSQDCGDNVVYMYKNDGAGHFTLKGSFHIGANPYGTLQVMDLNGDLNMDVINWSGSHFYGFGSYALGHGNWVFDHFGSAPAVADDSDLEERDLNRDSRHDVMVTSWMDPGLRVGINTGAYSNCAPPSAAAINAKICGPANNASVASPVAIKASGNSPVGIQRLEIWIDGHKQYEKLYDQLTKRLSLSAGTHRITVVAVDKYLGTGKSTINVTVH